MEILSPVTLVLKEEPDSKFIEQSLDDPALSCAQRQEIFDSWDYRELMVAHRHEVVCFGQFFDFYNKTTLRKVATSDYRQIALMWREEGVPVGVFEKKWRKQISWGRAYFLALVDAVSMGFPGPLQSVFL